MRFCRASGMAAEGEHHGLCGICLLGILLKFHSLVREGKTREPKTNKQPTHLGL